MFGCNAFLFLFFPLTFIFFSLSSMKLDACIFSKNMTINILGRNLLKIGRMILKTCKKIFNISRILTVLSTTAWIHPILWPTPGTILSAVVSISCCSLSFYCLSCHFIVSNCFGRLSFHSAIVSISWLKTSCCSLSSSCFSCSFSQLLFWLAAFSVSHCLNQLTENQLLFIQLSF